MDRLRRCQHLFEGVFEGDREEEGCEWYHESRMAGRDSNPTAPAPRRVGILSSWPRDIARGSGTARYLLDLSHSLRAEGCRVVDFGADLDPSDYERFVGERFRWNERIAHDHRIREVDLVLAVDFDGYAVHSGPPLPPKVVCPQGVFAEMARTEPEPFRSILERQAEAERVNLAHAAAVIAPSDAAAQSLIRWYGVDPSRVHAIPHGFDLHAWSRLIRGAALERDRPLTILTVARLYPRKNVETIVRLMPGLRRVFEGLRLRIVGDGIDGMRLRALAGSLSIDEGIVFEGGVDDPARMAFFYRNADLFCLPSLFETFGFVFLEAMAAGIPVVSGNRGGADEVVGAGGVRVDPLDSAALERVLTSLLADPEGRAAMGRAGRERAAEFTWHRTAAGYLELAERVLARPGWRRGRGTG